MATPPHPLRIADGRRPGIGPIQVDDQSAAQLEKAVAEFQKLYASQRSRQTATV